MRKYIHKLWHRVLVFLHLSPLSLAEKCRLAFGGAVILILLLALLLPYIWMNQLTKKACLDAGRAGAESLMRSHFQLNRLADIHAPLDITGTVMDANDSEIQWIRFSREFEKQLEQLSAEHRKMVELLMTEEHGDDSIVLRKKDGILRSNYVRIFRASDNCLSCHNPQGPAAAFNQGEAVGTLVIQRPVSEISETIFLNRIVIIVAGLIAGAGAIVTFYMITQRVILRPIRQLRALANNVAEGNLDIRSAIKTGDEYEKLAKAFNHMLDNLQGSQDKLRQANIQLDGKIAELSERNIELFKANKIKGEFLANISHEFRTPLNAILGFAEILHDKPEILKKEKGRRYAENIVTSGKNLLNMINDLLDMAKTEAGKMKLHIASTSISELCKALVSSVSLMTKKERIKVKLVVNKKIPVLMTDSGKVSQVLHNFLSNAVKFTPRGGRIEICAQMKDEKTVRISVSDTGCGIADSDKEKIFEKFRQADGSITRESSGSGLGLAICTELAAMLAGTIGMESEQGKGSTFWLDIPVTIPASTV